MKVHKMLVVKEDLSWKGTWYRKGQIFFGVPSKYNPRCQYDVIGHGGGVNFTDITMIKGLVATVQCFCISILLFAGIVKR